MIFRNTTKNCHKLCLLLGTLATLRKQMSRTKNTQQLQLSGRQLTWTVGETTRGETVTESLSSQERLDENGGKQGDNNDEVCDNND